MKKLPLDKIKTCLLILVGFALVVTGVLLYQEKQESKRQYEIFLNHFYHELTSVMQPLDSILEKSLEGKELEQALQQVEQNLEATDRVLNAGSLFVDRDIASHVSFFSNHPINQFADDNTLTNEEVQYLENLKEDLDTIQMGLYSDETGQENPELSIRVFNDIITGGSGHDSGFLTEHKSVSVPFQMIDPKQAPERIQKWMEHNTSTEQKKVFLVDGRTYVLIVSDHGQNSFHQVEITEMARTGGGIKVAYESEEQSVHGDNVKQELAVAIAELEMETERSFQFTSLLEDKQNENGSNSTSHVSVTAEAELVFPEKLSIDGDVIK
ncbi:MULTISPECIES: hypothetical protein [Bacillaceae]|uniref:Germination protein YpeB n=1 Tax=Lentibacillus salinarum TaxID=446820 RepID=A0ABW3ZY15_9BACI|nr:hypothetical protein [Paraliobacillus ryukyuensis]